MITTILEYLETTTAMGSKLDEFILTTGQPYALSPDQSTAPLGEIGQCYMNAYHLSQENSWEYVEGYATTRDIGIPLMHAWCVNEQGDVIDPTWEHGNEYFGVVVPPHVCTAVMLGTEVYGVLPNLWMFRGDREWVLDQIRTTRETV